MSTFLPRFFSKKVLFFSGVLMVLFAAPVLANAAPIITNISPATIATGSPAFMLTINGSGFDSTSSVNFNVTFVPTTFISPTQLTAAIPASYIPTLPQSVDVLVRNGSSSFIFSNTVVFVVAPTVPPPVITSISPTSFAVGTAVPTLTVNGSNFSATTQIGYKTYINGVFTTATSLGPASFVNTNQLLAVAPYFGSTPPAGATFTIYVDDPVAGSSNEILFTVTGSKAAAAASSSTTTSGFNPGNIPNAVTTLSINGLIDIFFNILWPLFIAFAIIMFILGGVAFFNAQGDPDKVATARNQVLWGIAGLAVAFLAFSLPFIVRLTLNNGI